jgi:hypothetical protein
MHDEENGSNVEMAKAERKQNNETSSWRIWLCVLIVISINNSNERAYDSEKQAYERNKQLLYSLWRHKCNAANGRMAMQYESASSVW